MSDAIAASAIVLEVRRLANQETLDETIALMTDAEILSRANRNLKKVYLALIRARGANYYRTETDLATTAGVATVNLPATFLSLISLSRQVGTNEWEPLLDFNEAQRNDFDIGPTYGIGTPSRYQLQQSTIRLTPTPRTAETLRLAYVPAFTALTLAPDTSFDGVCGFEEWAIWETVVEAKDKDAADYSLALSKAQWWEREVESMAKERDGMMPMRVQRTRRQRRYERYR